MRKHSVKVAVTAVGGGVGQSIVKALQKTEYEVVGVNSELFGTGLYATKRSYLGYAAKDSRFIDRLKQICEKEKCAILFPGLDAELAPISKHSEELRTANITPIVSDPRVIEICGDKFLTYDFLKKNSFPYPKTYRLREFDNQLDFPVILKPQKGGHRSIGQFTVGSTKELELLSGTVDVDNYVVQEYIEGEEYTCGTVTLENKCVGSIIMRRELRNGDTVRAFVVQNEELASFLRKVINVLKPFGACNVQLRLRDGVPYIFELNARCSGTTAARALAGFNEPKIICDYVCKRIQNPVYTIREIVILRYLKEFVVEYPKIDKLAANGHLSNKKVEL